MQSPSTTGYELIDSGAGLKLERFGDKMLCRPSSLCIWKPRKENRAWEQADARYEHERGWKYRAQKFEEWTCNLDNFSLRLRTQDNGQVGFFPEHALYMPRLVERVKSIGQSTKRPTRVLNLFAYTGMASVVCVKAGAHVTHVDLSKKALDWASTNFEHAAGSQSDKVAAITEGQIGNIGKALMNNSHSRQQETEADTYSYDFMKRNGYNVNAVESAFSILAKMSEGTESTFITRMMSSHPDAKQRAENAKARAQVDGLYKPYVKIVKAKAKTTVKKKK